MSEPNLSTKLTCTTAITISHLMWSLILYVHIVYSILNVLIFEILRTIRPSDVSQFIFIVLLFLSLWIYLLFFCFFSTAHGQQCKQTCYSSRAHEQGLPHKADIYCPEALTGICYVKHLLYITLKTSWVLSIQWRSPVQITIAVRRLSRSED